MKAVDMVSGMTVRTVRLLLELATHYGKDDDDNLGSLIITAVCGIILCMGVTIATFIEKGSFKG